jgi:hypothetical protein
MDLYVMMNANILANAAAKMPQTALRLPSHAIYTHWKFGEAVSCLEFTLQINNDPGSAVGSYICFYNATIDGIGTVTYRD